MAPSGAQIAARIDQTIAKLPGLEWFDRLTRSREEALRKSGFAPLREPAVASGDCRSEIAARPALAARCEIAERRALAGLGARASATWMDCTHISVDTAG